jgi:hypothetical protein
VVIDHDRLRSALTTIPFDQAARFAYNIQWDLVQHFAQQGHNIIIDSTCNYAEVLDRGSECAAQHVCAYWYVECRAKAKDIDLLDRRLRARNSLPSQRTAVDSPPQAAAAAAAVAASGGEDQRAVFRKWMEDPCRPAEDKVIVVDSTGEPGQLRDQVLARMLG